MASNFLKTGQVNLKIDEVEHRILLGNKLFFLIVVGGIIVFLNTKSKVKK